MSTPADPQNDPTMEEILASIRKIISDDKPGVVAGTKTARLPEQRDGDILELTEELPPEQERPQHSAAVPSVPAPVRPKKPQENTMLSDTSRNAIDRAFDSLDKASAEFSTFSTGTLEAVFARAVQDAIAPNLQQWVNTHKAELIETFRPIIRNWMDEHLPPLVDEVLKQEFGRAVAEHLRRRLA